MTEYTISQSSRKKLLIKNVLIRLGLNFILVVFISLFFWNRVGSHSESFLNLIVIFGSIIYFLYFGIILNIKNAKLMILRKFVFSGSILKLEKQIESVSISLDDSYIEMNKSGNIRIFDKGDRKRIMIPKEVANIEEIKSYLFEKYSVRIVNSLFFYRYEMLKFIGPFLTGLYLLFWKTSIDYIVYGFIVLFLILTLIISSIRLKINNSFGSVVVYILLALDILLYIATGIKFNI